MTALEGWKDFYVMLGSCAGALIGLQFVVMTLIAEAPAVAGEEKAGRAFLTPNRARGPGARWARSRRPFRREYRRGASDRPPPAASRGGGSYGAPGDPAPAQ